MIVDILYLSPVITGIVEAAKRAGLPSQFCPFVAIVLGVGLSFLIPSDNIAETIVNGLAAGLSAVGLYEAVAQPAIKALTHEE